MGLKAFHIFVSGKVQGVGFRIRTRFRAANLDLKGWVKNLEDGRVEILAEGEEEKIKELLNWIKSQPAFSRVENVEIKELPFSGKYHNFEIRY